MKFLLPLFLVCATTAYGQLVENAPGSKHYDIEWILGLWKARVYRFSVSSGEIAKSPTWPVTQDNPPLSPREAIQAAEARLKSITPTPPWKFSHVELEPLDSGHWMYLVTFVPIVPPSAAIWGNGSEDNVPVLLNGFVPEAKLIHDGSKGPGN